jgi:hypothetical protein
MRHTKDHLTPMHFLLRACTIMLLLFCIFPFFYNQLFPSIFPTASTSPEGTKTPQGLAQQISCPRDTAENETPSK